MQEKNNIQIGVEVVNPGVVKIINKVNNVTGDLLSLWTKSTVHGTNREAVHQNSGKDYLTISQLTLAKEPTGLQPWHSSLGLQPLNTPIV